MGRVDEILAELVLLKSTQEDDVSPIVDYVSEKLGKLGLKPRLYGEQTRPALIFQSGKGGVMLSGHLDTVPHGVDWDYEDGEVIDGKLYGRGACDMKGGCAAMLLAAENLVSAEAPFTLCFTSDEETTMNGASAASKDAAVAAAPAVCVAEPTAFDIVIKEKGLLQFKLATKGASAHASMPELGENAISKMIGLLCKIDDLQKVPRDTIRNMTMCVDTIKGGTKINVIPSDCEVEIDVRYPADMTPQEVLKLVKDRIGNAGYELNILHQLDPIETDPKLPAVTTLMEIMGGARLSSVPYATEMVMFRSSNKALMVCGPGDPKVCHMDNEHIMLADVARAAEIYTEFCTRMAAD